MCDDKLVDLWDSGAPARDLNGTGFIDDLLLQRVLQVISSHDFDAAPLFIHYTPHATHDPLQVRAAPYRGQLHHPFSYTNVAGAIFCLRSLQCFHKR